MTIKGRGKTWLEHMIISHTDGMVRYETCYLYLDLETSMERDWGNANKLGKMDASR
jgi:hypothetical protein